LEAMLAGVKLNVTPEGKTEYLLFLGEAEIEGLAAVAADHWDALMAAVPSGTPADDTAPAQGRRGGRQAKQAGRDAVPAAVREAVLRVLDGPKAADLALFGRMLADLPDRNVDAASQVAHALSTNRVNTEFDFYTAVDDLRPEETAGADMLGTIEFNSACFYRYANVDLETLKGNLGGDEELARRTLDAFLRAAITAIPTGKQNSMAAQNPPSFVFVVARERGQWSLANAFVAPIHPGRDGDLIKKSVTALDDYWGKLARMYGADGIVATAAVALDSGDELPLANLGAARVESVAALLALIDAAVGFGANGAGPSA